MKVFVNYKLTDENVYFDKSYYNYAIDGEILFFDLFQKEQLINIEYSMLGITSLEKTTYITVKDIDISKQFYTELILEAIKKKYVFINIDSTGKFNIKKDGVYTWSFNIHTLIAELLVKADLFNENDELICVNRTLYLSQDVSNEDFIT